MRSQAYWAERATQRMQKVEQMAGRYEAKIIRAYRRTVKNINADVEKLMRRYMWEFGLTEEEALELLNEKVSVQEIKLLQSRLDLVKDPKVKKEIAKKIEAKAYAYRISRLEAVKVDMRMHMEGLKETSHEILTEALQDVSRESRRLLIKDLGEQAKERGLSIQFGKFDKAVFDTITKERWYGKNYSERVWTNLGKLEKTMYNTWLDGVIQGDSNQRIAKQLSEQMNVGIYAAKRLVRTETCHYTNQIAKKEFEEDGITKYEFSAHLDKRTSDLCRDLDGKVFNVADAAVGKNYPPMHPHCRSVAVAWFGDEEEEELRAINPIITTLGKNNTPHMFISRSDELFQHMKLIKPLEGYKDIVIHSDGVNFYHYTADGNETRITPKDFAKMIIKANILNPGDKVRLCACSAGKKDGSAAKQLSNFLGVEILAPTTDIQVDFTGKMYLNNKKELKNVGEWVTIKSEKEA